jgi:short-subunit dehydrogenase
MVKPESGVVITGASRGIGAAIALHLSKTGKNPLLLIARDATSLENTASECRKAGGRVLTVALDLNNDQDLDQMQIPAGFRPSVLINNAGNYIEKNLFDTEPADYLQQFSSNVMTAVSATGKFLPLILENTPGLVVNICSVASLTGLVRSPAYSVSKHALLGYSRSLGLSLRGSGVAVTALNLGPTDTGSWADDPRDKSTLISAVDVARVVEMLMNVTERVVAAEILIEPSSTSS